jgi:hypothetical protein
MSRNDSFRLAQELFNWLGSGAELVKIAELFSESMKWEIAGDVLPWFGKKSGGPRSSISLLTRAP